MNLAANRLFIASTAAFVLFSAAAGVGMFVGFDRWALRASQTFASDTLDALGSLFSLAGSIEVVSAALAVVMISLFLSGRGWLGMWLLAAFIFTGIVELALKLFLPTPPLSGAKVRADDPTLLVALEHPFPYPSGHTLRMTLLLGAIILLWDNRISRSAMMLCLAGMAFSRVYLGVHWASDVIGGALLGIVGLAWVFKRSTIKKRFAEN